MIGNFYEKLERCNTHSGVNSLRSRCVQKFGEKAIGRCCYFVNELSNTGTLSPSHSSRKEVDVILSTVIPSTFTLDFGYWCYFSPLAQVLIFEPVKYLSNACHTCQMCTVYTFGVRDSAKTNLTLAYFHSNSNKPHNFKVCGVDHLDSR